MNYKAVIEEQIKELQKRQEYLACEGLKAVNEACTIALTIAELCEKANQLLDN